jgi:hypothetical protein
LGLPSLTKRHSGQSPFFFPFLISLFIFTRSRQLDHKPLRLGTLNAILREVAAAKQTTREAILGSL